MLLTHFLSQASIVIISELVFSVNRPSGEKRCHLQLILCRIVQQKKVNYLKKIYEKGSCSVLSIRGMKKCLELCTFGFCGLQIRKNGYLIIVLFNIQLFVYLFLERDECLLL